MNYDDLQKMLVFHAEIRELTRRYKYIYIYISWGYDIRIVPLPKMATEVSSFTLALIFVWDVRSN